jgi:hypothetical protein
MNFSVVESNKGAFDQHSVNIHMQIQQHLPLR